MPQHAELSDPVALRVANLPPARHERVMAVLERADTRVARMLDVWEAQDALHRVRHHLAMQLWYACAGEHPHRGSSWDVAKSRRPVVALLHDWLSWSNHVIAAALMVQQSTVIHDLRLHALACLHHPDYAARYQQVLDSLQQLNAHPNPTDNALPHLQNASPALAK